MKSSVYVVEASAGSGKTFCLARRYVQLSLSLARTEVIPIQSILAITFTNKATREMKSRILDFLKRIALKQLKPFEIQDILESIGMDEQEASRLAFRVMNDVIRQYHYFQVQTIDSFVNILLVGCSFKIGLSAHFKIQRNSKEYLQLSLDELLDQAGSDERVRLLFENFVRQYLFLENRSGWFPKEDLLKVICELFRQYNTYQKPLLVYSSSQEPFSAKRKIYLLMQELKGLCPPQTNKKFMANLEGLLDTEGKLFDVDELNAAWAREEFPVNKGGVISLPLEKLWKKIRREIVELCLLEAHSLFNPYIILFEKILFHFGELSRRDDVLFLEELNQKASMLFEDHLVTVEELYFRLAARFSHYLMDEFQDTSLSQWRNLSMMVEEALSHGGSLFYVGDKKQAIYAFRGGESRLFDALQSRLIHFNVQIQNLDKNYRSCPEIIKFNNRVFSLVNLEDFLDRRQMDALEHKRLKEIHFSPDDFQKIAHTFAHAHQTPGKDLKGGVIRVMHLQGRNKQERSLEVFSRLLPLLHDLSGHFALRDIAILTRGNDEVEEITQWLLQEGIYAQSERSSDIKNNSLIGELMNLLAFLNSPVDNNAFAQFCLGEVMPKSAGMSPQELRDFLFSCALRQRQSKELYFYKCFREQYPNIWEKFFEGFFQHAGVYPLYELAAGIIDRFECEKNFPHVQGFLMHFLELIKSQEAESCDLSSFLDYFENLEGEDRFVPMAKIDAVRILTVHKAKGLEFPVVIVPFLEMDIKAGSGGRDGAQAYILDIQEDGMSMVRIKESYRQFCPELQARYEQEYKKSFLIELNSVYVALTRAIEELYIFVPDRVGNTINPARFLIPEDCWAFGTPADRPRTHQKEEIHHQIKPFVSDPWVNLREEFLDRPARSALAAHQGEFYHSLLMHIGNLDESNVSQELQNAWDKACRTKITSLGKEEVIGQLTDFINREDVRSYFYLSADAAVFCEKEFVNSYGDTKRIDRFIVLKDKVWIVDFKLSPLASDVHEKQVKEYEALVKQFYPEHKVSGYVLYLQNSHLG